MISSEKISIAFTVSDISFYMYMKVMRLILIDCIFMDQAGPGDEFLELGHK